MTEDENSKTNKLRKAKRILVIGSSGAGKSTVTSFLSKKLNIPAIYLDAHYYRENWTPIEDDEWRIKVQNFVKQDSWIIDGDFSDSFNIRFPKAEVVLDLAYSRYLCTYRAMFRLFTAKKRGRIDLANDCEESFDLNNLKWIWNYPNRVSKGSFTPNFSQNRT